MFMFLAEDIALVINQGLKMIIYVISGIRMFKD